MTKGKSTADKDRRHRSRVLHYIKRGLEGVALMGLVKIFKKTKNVTCKHLHSQACHPEPRKGQRFVRSKAFLKNILKSFLKI